MFEFSFHFMLLVVAVGDREGDRHEARKRRVVTIGVVASINLGYQLQTSTQCDSPIVLEIPTDPGFQGRQHAEEAWSLTTAVRVVCEPKTDTQGNLDCSLKRNIGEFRLEWNRREQFISLIVGEKISQLTTKCHGAVQKPLVSDGAVSTDLHVHGIGKNQEFFSIGG